MDSWAPIPEAFRALTFPLPRPWEGLFGPLRHGRIDDLVVVAQIGQSLDGRVATETGHSHYINGPAGLAHLHRLRALMDAVVVGVGTALADDPQLTVRHVNTSRQPLRVVVDSRLDIPVDAGLLRGGGELIFTATASEGKILALREVGARVIVLPGENGGVDLAGMMQQLADFEINEVLIEAGFKLNGALINAGLVDELVIYLAPCLLGDAARGMLKLPELENLADKRALKINDVRMVGTDIRLTGSFL